MKGVPGQRKTARPFAFFRVPDCTMICQFDMKDFELINNTSSKSVKNKIAN
jgi:hypothetical protein